jgi:hypothetical protein
MAAATVNFRKKGQLGGSIVEWINVTFNTGDTVETQMQNPEHAMAVTNVDGGDGTSTSISGKTITLTNAGIAAGVANVLVIGF